MSRISEKSPVLTLTVPGAVTKGKPHITLLNHRRTNRHTDQRCSSGGHTEAAHRPSQATFACRACGLELHADCNAARNVLWLGSSLRREKREAKTGAA
jgi:hypothetical protein